WRRGWGSERTRRRRRVDTAQGHDEEPDRRVAQAERRARERERRRHRILRLLHRGRRSVVRRHDDGRRPAVPERAARDQLQLQTRAERRQVGAAALQGVALPLTPRLRAATKSKTKKASPTAPPPPPPLARLPLPPALLP